MREKLEKLLKPLDLMLKQIPKLSARDNLLKFASKMQNLNIFNAVKVMMETIYEGVDLPCREQAQLLIAISLLYRNVSRAFAEKTK